MKKISTFFMIFIIALLCVATVSATDYVIWDFSDEATVSQWIPSSTTNVTVTADGAVISGSGDNINLTYNLTTDLNLKDYQYFVYEYSNSTTDAYFNFFHWIGGNPYDLSQEIIACGDQANTAEIDLSNYRGSPWWREGEITSLRLDPSRSEVTRSITVRYIGLFKDESAYRKYQLEKNASIDYVVWDFSDEDTVSRWIPSSTTNVTVTADGAVISGSGDNINLTYTPAKELNLEDYPYFVYEYSNSTAEGTYFQFYHWTGDYNVAPCLTHDIHVCGDQTQTVEFDLKNNPPASASWQGRVSSLRLDPTRSGATGERSITVKSVGMFKDKKTYLKYKMKKISDRNIVWDFSDELQVLQWTPSPSTDVEITEKGTVISGEGDAISLTYTLQGESNLKEYQYFVYEYSNSTTDAYFNFFHWIGDTPYDLSQEIIAGGDQANTVEIDLSNYRGSPWWREGEITSLRFDPSRSDENRSITIRYVGLFKDESEYRNYQMARKNYLTAAGKPVAIYNPDISDKSFPENATNCTIEYDYDYAIITSTNGPEQNSGFEGDPNFLVKAEFDGDKWQWMKVRLRNLSDATHFEMYFSTKGTDYAVTSSTCTRFPITSYDGDFKEYIINVKDANLALQSGSLTQSLWTGFIKDIRLDCMWKAEPSGQMASGSQMYIDYVAFFSSREDAENFATPKKPNPVWIFDNHDTVMNQSPAGADISFAHGMMKVVPLGVDPRMNLSLRKSFDSQEFPYFAYRHSTKTNNSEAGAVLYTTDTDVDLAQSYTSISLVHDGSMSNSIIDMRTHDTWQGDILSVRFDPINSGTLDAEIYIDRMGFFRTSEEAAAFLSHGKSGVDYSTHSVFTATLQKSIVPGNTLSSGYKKADYMLSSTTPAGQGQNPVVIRTNADGSEQIVALGYTNPAGFTTFVANKAGNYTLVYNDKSYVDTAGHWGENYIDFVSAREMLCGTSQTQFSPDMPMTRGMFVVALGRMHGVDTSAYDGDTGYSDVAATQYYAPYIQWAEEKGIMAGESATEFAPERPISRQAMAVVIANYIKEFEYETNCYDDPIEFTDISDLDDDTIEDINYIAQIGIINGVGDGEFDPDGFCTRAEVAAVMERVIKAVLGVNTATTQYNQAYFNRDHIKIGAAGLHTALGNKEGMDIIKDLGVNLIISGSALFSADTVNRVFNYADKYGISIFGESIRGEENVLNNPNLDPAAISAEYSFHPSFAGHFVRDEPGSNSFAALKQFTDKYESIFPGKIPFITTLPLYATTNQLLNGPDATGGAKDNVDAYQDYCQAWFDTFDADYICTDIYPLQGQTDDPDTWVTYSHFCEAVNQVATAARQNNAEFWCYIQTWGYDKNMRDPDEAAFRWQSYSMLSYGATGIMLWTLVDQFGENPSLYDYETGTLKQPLYNDCKTVLNEIARLSDTYVQYKNLGAFTVNCTADTPWLRMSGEYENFSILSEVVSNDPLLIGCFDKKQGSGHAFTVVNMTDLKYQAGATLKFKLAQNLNVTLHSKAGVSALSADANGYYTINLDTGDGVFVTIS